MKRSRRARRMVRSHARRQGAARLNLVSLMDIFTILVFFLMVNSSDIEVLPADKRIKLPDSISTQQPGNGILIAVNDDFIAVNGDRILEIKSLQQTDSVVIPALVGNLSTLKSADPEQKSVTIMGDREIPYTTLKRIMASCAEANFIEISLAVNGQQTATMPETEA